MNTTEEIRFTRNKKTGRYDVIGPAHCISRDTTVDVTKKSGETTRVMIAKASRPFTAKFGPLKGLQARIGTVASHRGNHGSGDRYAGTNLEGVYCGFPCPVTGRKCCPQNGPCHDCQ